MCQPEVLLIASYTNNTPSILTPPLSLPGLLGKSDISCIFPRAFQYHTFNLLQSPSPLCFYLSWMYDTILSWYDIYHFLSYRDSPLSMLYNYHHSEHNSFSAVYISYLAFLSTDVFRLIPQRCGCGYYRKITLAVTHVPLPQALPNCFPKNFEFSFFRSPLPSILNSIRPLYQLLNLQSISLSKHYVLYLSIPPLSLVLSPPHFANTFEVTRLFQKVKMQDTQKWTLLICHLLKFRVHCVWRLVTTLPFIRYSLFNCSYRDTLTKFGVRANQSVGDLQLVEYCHGFVWENIIISISTHLCWVHVSHSLPSTPTSFQSQVIVCKLNFQRIAESNHHHTWAMTSVQLPRTSLTIVKGGSLGKSRLYLNTLDQHLTNLTLMKTLVRAGRSNSKVYYVYVIRCVMVYTYSVLKWWSYQGVGPVLREMCKGAVCPLILLDHKHTYTLTRFVPWFSLTKVWLDLCQQVCQISFLTCHVHTPHMTASSLCLRSLPYRLSPTMTFFQS